MSDGEARKIRHWVDNHFANNVYSKRDKGMIVDAIRDFNYQEGYVQTVDAEAPLLTEIIMPSVYDIQRSWTGLSWETCERLHDYILPICQENAKAARDKIVNAGWREIK